MGKEAPNSGMSFEPDGLGSRTQDQARPSDLIVEVFLLGVRELRICRQRHRASSEWAE